MPVTPKILTEADRERILKYIEDEPEMNLFVYGDIENHGVEGELVSVTAFADASGAWDALLQRYMDYYILYSKNAEYDAAAVAEYIKNMPAPDDSAPYVPDCVSGKAELIQRLAPYFPGLGLKVDYLTRCSAVIPGAARALPEGVEIRALGAGNAGEICALLMLIDEFAESYVKPGAVEKEKRNIKTSLEHGSLVYGVYENGALVATASTSAANSKSAMIVSVATHPNKRGHGYASAVVEKLCTDSFAQGKRFLCLFYDNPAAGRIYERIGFRYIGEYAMLG